MLLLMFSARALGRATETEMGVLLGTGMGLILRGAGATKRGRLAWES